MRYRLADLLGLPAPALAPRRGGQGMPCAYSKSLLVKGRRSAMTPDLEEAICDYRGEPVELVAADGWPPESLDL